MIYIKGGFLINSNASNLFSQKSRLSPDAEAKFFCEAGLDKDGFEVKYLSDYKGIYLKDVMLVTIFRLYQSSFQEELNSIKI